MWRLKFSDGGRDDPWLTSVNNHIGRQLWEFDANLGTPEEQAQVEKARREFHNNRFHSKHSSDMLMRLQVHIFCIHSLNVVIWYQWILG